MEELREETSNQQPALSQDTVVAGRYKILSLIARGGMGSVYLVEDTQTKKRRALKTLSTTELSDLALKRFEKEAKAAMRLDHPGLVRVHEVGTIGEKQPFYVMDYFDGETLAHHLKKNGPLSTEQALPIFMEVCFALAAAHKKGVIHRDIKPSNIMLSNKLRNGEHDVKVVDFGLAKMFSIAETESMSVGLTRTGEIFGTPYYMSPEQCRSEGLDQRSDIYSLGCVMFEALTGMVPFFGDTILSTMMKHQSDDPPSLKTGSLGRTFPEALEKVVAKMLAKNREDRYEDLIQVAGDLNRIKSGSQVTVTAVKQSGSKKDQGTKNQQTILFVLFASIFAFVAGRFSIHPPAPTAKAEVSESKLPAEVEALLPGNRDEPPNDNQYFSTSSGVTPSTRLFHFPAKHEESLGILQTGPDVKMLSINKGRILPASRDAMGDVLIQNFEPMGLNASAYLTEHPEYLKHFRPDELVSLTIQDAKLGGDEMLEGIQDFQILRMLSVYQSHTLTNKCLQYIDKLPELEDLNVAGTKINGYGLARLGRLKQLKRLRTRGMGDYKELLERLNGSQALKSFDIRKANIQDKDLEIIASLRNLEHLDISQSKDVTDAGLQQLEQLQNLKELDAHQCSLTPASIGMLKHLPNLRRLTISTHTWSYADVNKLHAALPRCLISEDYVY